MITAKEMAALAKKSKPAVDKHSFGQLLETMQIAAGLGESGIKWDRKLPNKYVKQLEEAGYLVSIPDLGSGMTVNW